LLTLAEGMSLASRATMLSATKTINQNHPKVALHYYSQ